MGDAVKVGQTPKSQVDISPSIEDNILDLYDLPTYHFRLYMMADDAIRQKKFGPASREQRVVIAESGVTAVGIDEVEIHSVSGISREAGIGTATNFSLTLREPFGATLLDQISNAAKFLDIKNFAKIPFFLELSFRGRTTGDNSDQSAVRSSLRDLVWTWPMIFTKMAMNVDTGGTAYSIEAAIYGDIAYTNQAADIEKPITVDAATVGEFFTEFQAQMNLREEEKTKSAKYEIADTYEFYVASEIYDEKIVPDGSEERQNRSEEYNESTGKMSFSFMPPISIDRVVENVLSLTAFFQKGIKATESTDAAGDDKKGEDATTQLLYRLIADATMGEYDNVRQDYQRSFRYLVIPYEMSTLTTPSSNSSTQTSEQRYQTSASKGRAKQLYNYIYTGLNDQVLDFDLTFNVHWYAALPLQAGVSTNPAAAEPKATLTDVQKSKASEAADTINKARNFLSNPIGFNPSSLFDDFFGQFTGVIGDAQALVGDAQALATNAVSPASIGVSDIMGAQISAANAAIAPVQSGIAPIGEVVPGVGTILNIPVLTGPGTLVDRLTSATQFPRVASPKTSATSSGQENLRENDIFLDDPLIGTDLILKQSIIESASGDNNADTAQGAQTSGRTMLSAMFEQARTPLAADLLNIDLEIKGDPYWLEPPPINRNAAPRSTFDRLLANRNFGPAGDSAEAQPSDSADQNFTTADTALAQTFMVFRSFTPLEFDPETGITPAGKTSNNVLNGVYGVRTVTHSFSGGQFKQSLHAVRYPAVNLQGVDILSYLNPTEDTILSDGEVPLEATTATSVRSNTGDDGFGNTAAGTGQGTANTDSDTGG